MATNIVKISRQNQIVIKVMVRKRYDPEMIEETGQGTDKAEVLTQRNINTTGTPLDWNADFPKTADKSAGLRMMLEGIGEIQK